MALPTSTNVQVYVRPAIPAAIEAVALFVPEGPRSISAVSGVPQEFVREGNRLLRGGIMRCKAKEVCVQVLGDGMARRLVLVGLGNASKIDAEAMRIAGGALARSARKERVGSIALWTGALTHIDALVNGFLLASFDYREHKGRAQDRDDGPRPVRLIVVGAKSAGTEVNRGRVIADAQNFARTIASRPGNQINPPALAEVAQQLCREVGFKCRILDERQMQRLGMGGILAVGAGSAAPPRLIVMEYAGGGRRIAKESAPLLIVGKAITFDTGGISIKPADKMGRMIYDKCGGMAVLGAMCAIARLKLPRRVVGILSSAENHISASAYRPGDIIRMHNGVTVEVTNTDAEGRLVLGDALAWGIKMFKPSAVVDLATLTGGVIVALGRTTAGAISNNDELFDRIRAASERAGEKIWRLPLGEEQRDQIKSQHADIVNSAGRDGHPLQGGAFLSHFVPDGTPWVHLDIAGTADTEKELPYYGRGATGWGLRTLVEWVALA